MGGGEEGGVSNKWRNAINSETISNVKLDAFRHHDNTKKTRPSVTVITTRAALLALQSKQHMTTGPGSHTEYNAVGYGDFLASKAPNCKDQSLCAFDTSKPLIKA